MIVRPAPVPSANLAKGVTANQAAVVAKWHVKFGLDVTSPRQHSYSPQRVREDFFKHEAFDMVITGLERQWDVERQRPQ
jgi:hypothetical protein